MRNVIITSNQAHKPLVLVFLSIFACYSCTSKKEQARISLQNGLEYFEQEDYKNALIEVEKSISWDSTNNEARLLKGRIKYKLEHYEEALQILRPLLDEQYKIDTINHLLGQISFSLGTRYILEQSDINQADKLFSESVHYFSNAISANPYYFESYVEKNVAEHNLTQYNEALITINKAIELFPDSLILILHRGVEKSSLGDNVGGIRDLNRIILNRAADSSIISKAYRYRGNAFSDMNCIDSALLDLTNAILFDSKSSLAYYNRAGLYKGKGLKDKACEDYRKAAELGVMIAYDIIKDYCSK